MSPETTILLALVVPLVGALLIWMSSGKPNQREAVTLVTATALFLLVASLVPGVMAGGRPTLDLIQVIPGVPLSFTVEPLGALFATVATFLWVVTSVYSIGYMRGNDERHQTRYYVCFAVSLWSAVAVAFAANMFTLFLAYEVLTLITYPLVTHHGTAEAMRAGRTYLGLLLGTSIGLQLVAIVVTWQVAGTLTFAPGGILAGKVPEPVGGILLFLYAYGIGKAALMPVHRWLPAAMVAPAPVSALLHAVAVVKAGVFTVVKVVVYVFGLDYLADIAGAQWLVYAAGATIVAASIIALRTDDLKRRLAYSTVSQLSYIIMGAAILTPLSVIGAALHIAAHAFAKITLFFAAGSIYTATHKTRVSQLDGIGRRMPWTMAAFAVAAISMIGVPPTAGFISKWYILVGALEAHQAVAVAVIVVSTILNAAYFLPIVYAAFFRAPAAPDNPGGGSAAEARGEAPVPIVLALVLTAAGTVALFFFPGPVLDLARGLVGGHG